MQVGICLISRSLQRIVDLTKKEQAQLEVSDTWTD